MPSVALANLDLVMLNSSAIWVYIIKLESRSLHQHAFPDHEVGLLRVLREGLTRVSLSVSFTSRDDGRVASSCSKVAT